MKKINKLGFVGCLSCVSILGAVSGHMYYWAFMGFAPYFYYFSVTPDEMFVEHVRKAATLAFFTSLAATVCSFALMAVLTLIEMLAACTVQFLSPLTVLVFGLTVSIAVFTITLHYHEVKERRGLK